jgi:hypothetical protein
MDFKISVGDEKILLYFSVTYKISVVVKIIMTQLY